MDAQAFSSPAETASLAGGPQKFAQRAMITATCVPGLLYTTSGAESFIVAHSVSNLIRTWRVELE